MKQKHISLWFCMAAMVSLSACQRSAGFKRDQDYYGDADTQSYYNKSGGRSSPTQRLSSIGQPKKRIFVYNFWNDTPVKQTDVAQFASDELRRALFASKRVILSPEMKSDFGTSDFVTADKVKVAQLVRESRQLGVAVAVIGRIARIVFRQKGDDIGLLRQKQSAAAVDVEIKIFDVASGREIQSVGRSGEANSSALAVFESGDLADAEFRSELTKLAVRNTIQPLIPQVIQSIEKMSWEGRIAKIVGGKIYLNAGRTSGLVNGDILKVITAGQDIYDPSTGVYLGRSQGYPKGTIEVVDFIGPDGASADVHSGGNFQEGDLVQLY